jgi:hypothetical protein
MVLIRNEIESVRAIGLPCGIGGDGESIETPLTALVIWKSSLSDKLFQVYVNGRYAGTTIDCRQRQIVVPVPTSFFTPVRIEVFAVEPGLAHIDFSDEISQPLSDNGRVKIIMLRSQDLPIEAAAQVYFDNGTGQIDYDTPLTEAPLRIWPSRLDKAGFGMSRFGFSDFGFDSSAAVGFGKGSFGQGRFGLDADTIEWISPQLEAGVYKFAVKIFDKNGNESSASLTEPITVTPAAQPAEKLSVVSFDKQTNQLILNIS